MDERQQKEERQKLKELRRELEEKIKEIIPEALKSQTAYATADEQLEEAVVLDDRTGKQVIEALLFATSKPLSVPELSRIVKTLKPAQIQRCITELKEEYERLDRSYRINEVAQGYEISTLPQFSVWLAKLEKEKKAKQASLAALETLAILAYKQPVTRVEIEEIRGVDVSGVIATLLERGFVRIVGRKEMPGRPLVYGTTERFLEHFGLKSLGELPNINEIKTLVEDTIKREELLRKEQLVPVAADEENEAAAIPAEEVDDAATLAAKYDEISRLIDDVKVMSAKKISKIINPNAPEEKAPGEEPEQESPAEGAEHTA